MENHAFLEVLGVFLAGFGPEMLEDQSVGFGFESMGHKEGLSPEAKAAIEELQSHCSATPLECARKSSTFAAFKEV